MKAAVLKLSEVYCEAIKFEKGCNVIVVPRAPKMNDQACHVRRHRFIMFLDYACLRDR